jgi:hypothetical protein
VPSSAEQRHLQGDVTCRTTWRRDKKKIKKLPENETGQSTKRGLKEKSPALPGLLTNVWFDQLISRAWRSDAPTAKLSGSHCSCE